MAPYRFIKASGLLLALLACGFAGAQQVLTSVQLEPAGTNQYRVRYQLDGSEQFQFNEAMLFIYRKRGELVEEIFSGPLPVTAGLNSKQALVYNWRADTTQVKAGDLLQAKVVLSYSKPALVQERNRKPAGNKPPVANAGSFMELQLPLSQPVILNGSKSSDDERIEKVEWQQIAGPSTLVIANPASLVTQVSGPFQEGRYAFELKIADAWGDTAIDRIIINVRPLDVVQRTTADTAKANASVTTTQPNAATVQVRTPPMDTAGVNRRNTPPSPPVRTVAQTKANMPPLKGGPSNALVNILVPGLGHYRVSGDHYGNDRKAGSFLITAFYAGSLGGAAYYHFKSQDQYKQYIELSKFREYQHDSNGDVIGVRGANQALAKQHLKDAKTSQRNALILVGVGGGILVGDLVYTLVKGSKNKKQWQRDAGVRAKPFVISDGSSVAGGVRVNF